MNAQAASKKSTAAVAASASANEGETRGQRKTKVGVVVSTKMAKTIVVATMRQVMHRKYGKFVRRTSKFYAHDEKGECGVGDEVRITETRPMSRTKRWKLTEILKKAD